MASKSNFRNMKDAGKACIGCGRTQDHAELKKLSTYSRSYACRDCISNEKYRMCANRNPEGGICGHEVHSRNGFCPYCGCQKYIHGLEGEHDRQLAACVGGATAIKECPSYGSKLGTCGKTIFADVNGNFARLCPECDREWAEAVGAGIADMKGKFGLLDALEPVEEENSGRVLH